MRAVFVSQAAAATHLCDGRFFKICLQVSNQWPEHLCWQSVCSNEPLSHFLHSSCSCSEIFASAADGKIEASSVLQYSILALRISESHLGRVSLADLYICALASAKLHCCDQHHRPLVHHTCQARLVLKRLRATIRRALGLSM